MARRSDRITIAEVADAAGVSAATVSRVMNGRFAGEPDVADRVRATARRLAYSPSPLARGLATGATRTIAFVVPDLGNPSFQEMLHRFTRAAATGGYRVLIADSGESVQEEALLAVETRRRCDCLVLCAPRMPDDVLAGLAPSLHPFVLVNRSAPVPGVPSLSVDYRAGISALVRHLHGMGHRRLAYVGGPGHSASDAVRRAGLDDMAAELTDLQVHRLDGGSAAADGHEATEAVLATGASAVLAFNDLVAVGLLDGLAERGVRVPRDVSVTGFDDIPLARYLSPALTTAAVPWEAVGTRTWARLRDLIDGDTAGESSVFAAHVVTRASTGPLRRRSARPARPA